MLFSLMIVGFSSTLIYQYRDADTLISRGDFAWLLVGGILGVFVSCMGCFGARDPVGKYNLLFCYFFMLSVILTFFSVGYYLYRVFVLDLEAAAEGEVEGAFRLESAKEFNDLILSIYTVCCTGCPLIAGGDCFAELETEIEFDIPTCDVVKVGDLNDADVPNTCELVTVCDETQRDVNEGLDQGCILNSAVVPSYDLGDNFCIFFSDFATDEDGNDIVAPVAEGGCGGGNPENFVTKVGEFAGKNFILINIMWGLGNFFIFLAWFGALAMLLCPHRFEEWNK